MNQKAHITVLNALLSNCKRSDRDIAKLAKISQPTVTRLRDRLLNEGVIKAYMAIPDYAKLDFKFGAVTLCELGPDTPINKLSIDSIILNAPAISKKGDYVLVTLHRSMDDYRAFLKSVKALAVVLFATEGLEIKPVQLQAPFIVLE